MLIILIIFLNGLMIKKYFLKIKFIQFAVNANNIDYFLERLND